MRFCGLPIHIQARTYSKATAQVYMGKKEETSFFISQNHLGIAISAHGFKCIFVQTKDGFKDYLQLVFCNVTKTQGFLLQVYF